MFNFFEQWINVIFAGCYDNVTGNIIYIYTNFWSIIV